MKRIFGAIESPKDIRDIQLGKVQEPTSFPEKFINDKKDIPAYFQGYLPTCSAHAGAWLKHVQELRESGNSVLLSPKYLWIKIKQIDSYPLEAGTDMRSIFKTLKSSGICSSEKLSNTITEPLDSYSDPKQVNYIMDADAQPRIIKSYAFLDDRSWNGIKRAIYKNNEVVLLLRFDATFFGTDMPPKPFSEPYGHFVIAHSYDEDFIYIKDSADLRFPDKKLSKEWLPHIKEAGTTIDLPNEVVYNLTQQLSILQQVVVLLQKLKAALR